MFQSCSWTGIEFHRRELATAKVLSPYLLSVHGIIGTSADRKERCVSLSVQLLSRVLYRKSLDLIDVLLQLADEGFQAHVLDLFKFPVQYCPDLLLLGLLQTVREYCSLSLLYVTVDTSLQGRSLNTPDCGVWDARLDSHYNHCDIQLSAWVAHPCSVVPRSTQHCILHGTVVIFWLNNDNTWLSKGGKVPSWP